MSLKVNAREKKNLGGLDTVGACCGEECVTRAISKLEEVAPDGEFAQLRESCLELEIDTSEAAEPWWTNGVESKPEATKRIAELLKQIQFCEHDVIIVVGHSHFFRTMFQRFLHADVQRRAPELAARLKQEVLPNCGVACCELDFTRGLRMITDVRLLLAAPTPTGDHRLVVQRQFEQLAGPVIQLFSVRNPPHLHGKDSRPWVVMWLADSSGMHVGRKVSYSTSIQHLDEPTRPADQHIHRVWLQLECYGCSLMGTRLQATWPALELRATEAGGGTWNLARQLGRSHWDADTVLHLELREQARDC